MKGNIFSPGKLLLTSEYFVLDGALALAVPTTRGQEFLFEENFDADSEVVWKAYHQNRLWLSARISYKNWEILETNNEEAAAFVVKVLQNVQEMSSSKFKNSYSYVLSTNLQFPANYGLGSSSTLMNNLAEWANIDSFELNEKSLGGSGYDIAVAKEKSAVLYQIKEGRRVSEKINFNPDFSDQIIFIHLNQKQDSREGINHYRQKVKSDTLVEEFSEITKLVLQSKNLTEFSNLMEKHEEMASSFLEIQKVKDRFFVGCPSFVKSLGAWGGDFVMASKFDGYQHYFKEKGFSDIFAWNELVY